MTVLRDFESMTSFPEAVNVFILPWLIHLVGDIHQPLHTMQGFSSSHPGGDRGGNSVQLQSGNLHSYWDSRLGSSETDRFLTQLAETIQRRHPKPEYLIMDPEAWAQEGFELRGEVYAFSGNGTQRSPALFSDAYSVNARNVVYERAALAAYRKRVVTTVLTHTRFTY